MKKLLSTVLAGAIVASTASLAMANDGTSTAKVDELNQVYFLKGDSTKLTKASDNTEVQFYSTPKEVSGYDKIDIALSGQNGDKYTLVFGASPLSGTNALCTLAGRVKSNTNKVVDYIPLSSTIKQTTSKEYSTTTNAVSSDRGVSVTTRTSGVETYISEASKTMKEAAGVTITFNAIGKTDLYTIKHIVLNGASGKTKEYRILCHNKYIEAGDTGLADSATLNDDTGYYEMNGTADLYRNGKVLTASTVKAMRDNGYKYAMFMSNGVGIMVDKISKATVDSGSVTLNTDANVDATLRDRYAEAAGGSIVTFKVNSGFTKDTVQYQLDLNIGDATKGMSSGEQNKWTDGKKVFCYIVNKANLDTLANGSAADGIVSSEKMLPCVIKDEKLIVTTSPAKFDAEKEMLMFTLKELDIAKLPAVSGVSVDSASNAEVVAPVVSEVVSAPVADQVKDTAVVSEPAATGRAVTQTGASDVVALAIVLAAVSMGAAGTVAFRKAR